jgi:hypothetical protein
MESYGCGTISTSAAVPAGWKRAVKRKFIHVRLAMAICWSAVTSQTIYTSRFHIPISISDFLTYPRPNLITLTARMRYHIGLRPHGSSTGSGFGAFP